MPPEDKREYPWSKPEGQVIRLWEWQRQQARSLVHGLRLRKARDIIKHQLSTQYGPRTCGLTKEDDGA